MSHKYRCRFLLVVTLESAVSNSLFYPDVPLIHGMLAVFGIVCLDKLVDVVIRRWIKSNVIIDGQPNQELRSGQILGDGLDINKIGSFELMEMLRLKGVMNLASVSYDYIEPSRQLWVFPAVTPGMDRAIVPPPELGTAAPGDGPNCCCGCGLLCPNLMQCPACGSMDKTPAAQAPRW